MEEEIDNYIADAKRYINTHPDTTGTVNAIIALTISIQQIENQTKKLNQNIEKFDQTSSKLSTRLAWWTRVLAFATIALVLVGLFNQTT